MKKNIILITIVFVSQILFSQKEIIWKKKIQQAFAKINFLSLDLPENDPNMGFTGIHYNLMINKWSYAGLGIYGAVSGNKGGFFTLGINAGI
jgi:alkylation response protein AidB-like acyl-CoA dehydrogenase